MKLNQIRIPVTNIRNSIEFYEQLGLKLIERSLPDHAKFSCPDKNSTFILYRVPAISIAKTVSIYLEVKNVEARVQSLQDKGFVFEELPADEPWLWKESRLKDLDENQIIIYSGGGIRTQSSTHN
jgi:catechol 2,3-dioxygenase-like lactoylglutathione lyase family enzyme